MPDDSPAPAVSPASAERALAFLAEMSPDLRGAAIIGAGGEVIAADGDPEEWGDSAAALLEAADAAGEEPAEQVHVATEQGEVFALRHGGLTAVAVTDRFVLSSVLCFDMRSLLRGLAREAAARAEEGGS
ncbi:MAG: hypothetical protein U0R52_00465 [Solirubrobacterales bacterium]